MLAPPTPLLLCPFFIPNFMYLRTFLSGIDSVWSRCTLHSTHTYFDERNILRQDLFVLTQAVCNKQTFLENINVKICLVSYKDQPKNDSILTSEISSLFLSLCIFSLVSTVAVWPRKYLDDKYSNETCNTMIAQ